MSSFSSNASRDTNHSAFTRPDTIADSAKKVPPCSSHPQSVKFRLLSQVDRTKAPKLSKFARATFELTIHKSDKAMPMRLQIT